MTTSWNNPDNYPGAGLVYYNERNQNGVRKLATNNINQPVFSLNTVNFCPETFFSEASSLRMANQHSDAYLYDFNEYFDSVRWSSKV